MRKLLVILFITISLPLTAQEVRTARVIKKADAEKPEPTPAPRRSIIDRFFTREKAEPTPSPKPVSEAPKKTKVKPAPIKPAGAKPAVKAKAKQPEKPAPSEKPEESPEATPPAIPPAPTEKTPEEPNATVAAPAVKAGKGKAGAKPEKPDMSGLDEAGKYKAAKEAALKEQAIIDLKNKAESTIDAEEAKQATLNYNRALFKKIRAIEPSLDAYVDKLESAVLKRVK
jgi:hypothetical protein